MDRRKSSRKPQTQEAHKYMKCVQPIKMSVINMSHIKKLLRFQADFQLLTFAKERKMSGKTAIKEMGTFHSFLRIVVHLCVSFRCTALILFQHLRH